MESEFPTPPPSDAPLTVRRRPFSPRRAGRIASGLAWFLLIQAAALWLTLRLVAPTYPIGPLDLQVRLRPSLHGVTEIMLPPLGQVSARTHALPVTVSLLAAGTRVQSLKALVAQVKGGRSTLSQMRRDARRAGLVLFLSLISAAFLSAAAVAALVGRRSVRRSAVMGAACSGF